MRPAVERARSVASLGAIVVLVTLSIPSPEAHKLITSKYTYNEHVFSILRDRCGQCHVTGGATPMSLLTYQDALPWAESIREELLSERMPPWYADPLGPPVKAGYGISAREVDTIVTWASGGTPEGTSTTPPEPPADQPQWSLGEPDLAIGMKTSYTLAAGTTEDFKEFTLPTGLGAARWVEVADLRPGSRSMVRDATISIENGPVLAVWVSGETMTPAPKGTAFRVPARASLKLAIHYKKSWMEEQADVSDQSTIGLYFSKTPRPREIKTAALDAPAAQPASTPKFGTAIRGKARVLAVTPRLDRAYARVDVEGVLPGGRRLHLLRLRGANKDWPRRYWLENPVELPQGSTIEVTATPAPEAESREVAAPSGRSPLRVAIDYVTP